MDALVTIVVPFLNRQDTLPRLFASLRAVTYPHIEVLLVDNGSTDDSAALCRRVCSQSSHAGGRAAYRLLSCSRPGAAAARNVGLEAASGEYISFFDSDDEMGANFILDLMNLMGDADLAVARTRSVFDDGHEMVRARGGHSVEAHIIAQGLNTASWVACTSLVRRSGGWDETLRYWDDYELGVRLLLNSRKTVWSPGVYHRTYEYAGPRLTTTAGTLRVERSRQALDAIERDISGMGPAKAKRALALRRAIVRGQLEAQGLDARSITCNGLLAHLLRFYTRLGGRGAWRVAMKMV